MERSSGVLLHISSLPSPYGIGTLGKAAYAFADSLKAAGQKYWQLLPLGPTSYGDSPYQSFSTFAGNPYFIDLDLLIEDGLLTKEEVMAVDWGNDPTHVDYGKLFTHRFPVLRLAFSRGYPRDKAAVEQFRKEKRWLHDYAFFMALKKHFDNKGLLEWPDDEIRLRKPAAMARYEALLSEEIAFYTYLQYLFYQQWTKLKAYVNGLGIKIIGDMPIYVAMDSADLWAEPQFFQLDSDARPTDVSGVPPDYFSEDGQLWGNPLYDYDRMKADGFGWWIRRVEGAGQLFDVIRIDHFRGLESYWSVPATEQTAKKGVWKKGPGMDLVRVLTSWFHSIDFIAEDLGLMTPEVEALLKESGLPGMEVLEFAFAPEGGSNYLPHNHNKNAICYVGTHDNETLAQWEATIDKDTLAFAKEYLGVGKKNSLHWAMLRAGMASVSNLFVVQMQDLLELSEEGRMNTPGVASGNWQWRMEDGSFTRQLAATLLRYTTIYGRYSPENIPKKP